MNITLTKKIINRHSASNRFRFTAVLFAGTLIFFFSAFNLFALNVPPMRAAVNDYAKMLETRDVQIIENYLEKLNRDTGIQIAVLTVPSLEGDDLERFSMRTVEQWKLGQAGKDNGVLLLIAAAEKKIRIEVGYGLEGILTDMQCGLIIRNLIAPHFKNGDYGKGIIGAVQKMANLAAGGDAGDIDESYASEISDDDPAAASRPSAFVLFLFFVFMMIAMNRRRRRFGRYRGSGFARSAATAAFLSSLSKHSSGTSSWSGGSWGGGSGGGFSGGGGGFGGGGASGGW